jgi:predicted nucleic acid-binding protein
MPTARWVLFDTSVYIAAIHGGIESPAFLLLNRELPKTYLASVVSAELRAGATSVTARRAVEQFTSRAHKVGRVVAPGAGTFDRAGDLLGRIRQKEPRLRSKIPRFWNDLLIALSARELGAVLVTCDARDFELLRHYVRFELTVLN